MSSRRTTGAPGSANSGHSGPEGVVEGGASSRAPNPAPENRASGARHLRVWGLKYSAGSVKGAFTWGLTVVCREEGKGFMAPLPPRLASGAEVQVDLHAIGEKLGIEISKWRLLATVDEECTFKLRIRWVVDPPADAIDAIDATYGPLGVLVAATLPTLACLGPATCRANTPVLEVFWRRGTPRPPSSAVADRYRFSEQEQGRSRAPWDSSSRPPQDQRGRSPQRHEERRSRSPRRHEERRSRAPRRQEESRSSTPWLNEERRSRSPRRHEQPRRSRSPRQDDERRRSRSPWRHGARRPRSPRQHDDHEYRRSRPRSTHRERDTSRSPLRRESQGESQSASQGSSRGWNVRSSQSSSGGSGGSGVSDQSQDFNARAAPILCKQGAEILTMMQQERSLYKSPTKFGKRYVRARGKGNPATIRCLVYTIRAALPRTGSPEGDAAALARLIRLAEESNPDRMFADLLRQPQHVQGLGPLPLRGDADLELTRRGRTAG